MTTRSRFIAVYAALIGAAGPIAACSSTDTTTTAQQGAPATQSSATTAQTGTFTDAQLQAYLDAKAQIDPISAKIDGLSPSERQIATDRIRGILDQHSISADTYNAIATRARTDVALSNRLAGLRPLGEYTDAQLLAFIAASQQIDPISRTLANATPEQRAQATTQIRGILAANNIEASTYNTIAAQAQTNPELAERINALRADPSGGAPVPEGE